MKLWKWWVLVVMVVSGPWFGVTSKPQWDRVTWIPFLGKEDKPSDMAANILIFVPFGWSYITGRPSRRGLASAIGAGALVSFCAEAPQLFFLSRDPSATDLLMGVVGTVVGAMARRTWRTGVA